MKFEILSFREYGEPRLPKPKELKNIKPSFSVDYIPKKCKCQVFLKDGDIYVKHRDYFSHVITGNGEPLEVLVKKHLGIDKAKKFIYGDSWGSIVLRNEAWVKISEIDTSVFILNNLQTLLRQQEKLHGFEELELMCTNMERMWETVLQKYYEGSKATSKTQEIKE